MMFHRLVPALILAAAVSLPAFDDDMTKLAIEVKTLSGKPVERASVIVKFSEGRSVAKLGKKTRTAWELRTNQEGVARIPEIPRGKVLVQVIAKGYQTFGEHFDVNEAEKTIEIRLKPPQAQYSSH
ncbi:MAG: carboxypeptidase-like regulatory domain-containing protein [Bryobacteraceae bacterium]|nr:carboxypeptidase-like regulatory domain-containing protein [Bryobacteraceae bacterium]